VQDGAQQKIHRQEENSEMSKDKDRPILGSDGQPLPILPPERDARVWARLVRVMFYTPGFMGILLLKTGEPSSFGITIELLMLASAAAIVAGLFIGSQSEAEGADHASRVGTWSGALVMELLAAVPFLCAVPSLFHELANSTLLHAKAPDAVSVALGASELLPAMAILPFMLYQLACFGTLHYLVSKGVNWAINLAIFALIMAAYVANRLADYNLEKGFVSLLVILLGGVVLYGVLKLKSMQRLYDLHRPHVQPAAGP
jgi:hypothetical protein